MRLRRSDPGRPGYGRRRRGRGWLFLDPSGQPVRDPDRLGRLRELVIPPAWRDVWICPYPNGHIQAIGIDAAGRKQYLYHPTWREKRDEAKFDHVLEVARRLPVLRERVGRDLSGRGLHRDRVLATVTRLLDMGMFRVGSDQYAAGDDPTFGVSTLRPEHARSRGGCVVFEFPAKGGIEQVRRIEDPELCRVLVNLRRQRRSAGPPVRLPGRRGLARRAQRRGQRVPARRQRRGDDGEGLPHLARHGAGGDRTGDGGPAALGDRRQTGGRGGDA